MERLHNNSMRTKWKRLSLRSRTLLLVGCVLLGWQMLRAYTVWSATKQLRRLNVSLRVIQPDISRSNWLSKEIERVVSLSVNAIVSFGGSDWLLVAQDLAPGRGGVYASIGSQELKSGRMTEIVDQLVRLGTVQHLSIWGRDVRLTYEDFRQISRLKSLKGLSIETHLEYSVVTVTPLADLPRLTSISLDGEQAYYSEEILQFFLSIPTVKSIGLPQPSDGELAWVKRQRPDIVLHQTDAPP